MKPLSEEKMNELEGIYRGLQTPVDTIYSGEVIDMLVDKIGLSLAQEFLAQRAAINEFDGIVKAVEDFNDFSGHADIMFNPDTKLIWCKPYSDCNGYTVFANKRIVRLTSKGSEMSSNNEETNIAELYDYAKECLAECEESEEQ